MAKKKLDTKTAISKAAEASRRMTIQERTQILLRAGLVNQEQIDAVKRKLPVVVEGNNRNGK